jgi:hypothetical protein
MWKLSFQEEKRKADPQAQNVLLLCDTMASIYKETKLKYGHKLSARQQRYRQEY